MALLLRTSYATGLVYRREYISTRGPILVVDGK